jgi:POTRA domain, FtsQ-type
VGKPEAQTGWVPARFSSQTSASRVALADDGPACEEAFYRPSARKPISERPNLGSVPFRDKRTPPLDEEDEPFLRSRRRVGVRRGFLPQSLWGRIGLAAGAVILIGGLAWLGYEVRSFAAHDPRFRIDSSDNIQILGNSEVTKPELLSVFGGDMGRNVFFVPLRARRSELERLPWVETAALMRLLPNQLRVSVTERTPRRSPPLHAARDDGRPALFIPGHYRNHRQRSSFHPRRANEALSALCRRNRLDGREALQPIE